MKFFLMVPDMHWSQSSTTSSPPPHARPLEHIARQEDSEYPHRAFCGAMPPHGLQGPFVSEAYANGWLGCRRCLMGMQHYLKQKDRQ